MQHSMDRAGGLAVVSSGHRSRTRYLARALGEAVVSASKPTGLRDRLDLTRYAIRAGLIEPWTAPICAHRVVDGVSFVPRCEP